MELEAFAKQNEEKVIKIQSAIRGNMVRKEMKKDQTTAKKRSGAGLGGDNNGRNQDRAMNNGASGTAVCISGEMPDYGNP